jgi:hypothetical protein
LYTPSIEDISGEPQYVKPRELRRRPVAAETRCRCLSPSRCYVNLRPTAREFKSFGGGITALLEIELSLLEFAVSITRSVHAIEVSVVRDRISGSVS